MSEASVGFTRARAFGKRSPHSTQLNIDDSFPEISRAFCLFQTLETEAHSKYHTSACILFYVTLYRSGLSHGKLIAESDSRYPPWVCISNLLSDPIMYQDQTPSLLVANPRVCKASED